MPNATPLTRLSQAPRIRIVRAVSFSAAHRYFDRGRSEKENRDTFGSLYRAKGFGHNFLLEAHFEGAVDPLTGMIVNLVDIDRWLKTVTEELDHRHLNELKIFNDLAPTPERIAFHCYQKIRSLIQVENRPSLYLAKVRLYEGEALWVDYSEPK